MNQDKVTLLKITRAQFGIYAWVFTGKELARVPVVDYDTQVKLDDLGTYNKELGLEVSND